MVGKCPGGGHSRPDYADDVIAFRVARMVSTGEIKPEQARWIEKALRDEQAGKSRRDEKSGNQTSPAEETKLGAVSWLALYQKRLVMVQQNTLPKHLQIQATGSRFRARVFGTRLESPEGHRPLEPWNRSLHPHSPGRDLFKTAFLCVPGSNRNRHPSRERLLEKRSKKKIKTRNKNRIERSQPVGASA